MSDLRWRDDYGYKPNFAIPSCVESEANKNCSKESFSKWAEDQIFYRYWLSLREGTTEYSARFCLEDKLLRTLEHGRIYTWEELGKPGIKGKVQFIVEKA